LIHVITQLLKCTWIYELAAEAAHLTVADKLSQSTTTWKKQRRKTGKVCRISVHTPPNWDTFKEALFRDYPGCTEGLCVLEVLDEFIKESPDKLSSP